MHDEWTQGEDAFPPENTSLTGDRRTEARLTAVQALFNPGLLSATPISETELIAAFKPQLKARKADPKLFTLIVTEALQGQTRYQAMAHAHAREDWPIDRMDPILAALFWAASAELTANPAAGPKIILNEYLNIAKGFTGQAEVAWLNAVIAQIAAKIRGTL